jgi:hypothetical protein
MNTNLSTEFDTTLSIANAIVAIHSKGGVLHLGDYKAKGRSSLTTHGQVMGFFNAIAGVMTDRYPVLVKGLHLKFTTEDMEDMDDHGQREGYVGYVNFGKLQDAEWIEFFAKNSIAAREESLNNWLCLVLRQGVLGVHHAAQPKSLATLREMFPDEKLTPGILASNEADYRIADKHRGLELVIGLVAGTKQVSIMSITDKANFEWQATSRQDRFEALFGDRTTITKVMTDAIIAGREFARGKYATRELQADPMHEQLVAVALVEQAKTIVLVGDGTVASATPKDLVGHHIILAFPGGATRFQNYIKTVEEAIVGIARAKKLGATIQVLS